MKNKKYIRTLATAGVSAFLITGLTGCSSESDCIQKAVYAPNPQRAAEECVHNSHSTFIPMSSSTRSGFFSSSNSSYSS